MIGEMAVSEIRRRFSDQTPAPSAREEAVMPDLAHDTGRMEVNADVHPLSLLGVSELLAAIEEMAPEELASFKALEESGRRRPAILAAIDRRNPSGTA